MSTSLRDFVVSPVFRFWYNGDFRKVKIAQVLPGFFIGRDHFTGKFERFDWKEISLDRDSKFQLLPTLFRVMVELLGQEGIKVEDNNLSPQFIPVLLKTMGQLLDRDGFQLPETAPPPPLAENGNRPVTGRTFGNGVGLDSLLGSEQTPPPRGYFGLSDKVAERTLKEEKPYSVAAQRAEDR